MTIRLLYLSPLPFSWGGGTFVFYEDFFYRWFAETANVYCCLSFADQGKQNSVFRYIY
jgi:hypothetical protein